MKGGHSGFIRPGLPHPQSIKNLFYLFLIIHLHTISFSTIGSLASAGRPTACFLRVSRAGFNHDQSMELKNPLWKNYCGYACLFTHISHHHEIYEQIFRTLKNFPLLTLSRHRTRKTALIHAPISRIRLMLSAHLKAKHFR